MNNQRLTVAFIGCGNFARSFVPLFKAHPFVDKVYVCDLIREKAEKYSRDFEVPIIDTFEEALASGEINCIVNFTQLQLHGDIVIRALKAGKHVCSAAMAAVLMKEKPNAKSVVGIAIALVAVVLMSV